MRRLNRNQVVKIGRVTGSKNFIGKIEMLILNTLHYLKPVDRSENSNNMCGSGYLQNSTSMSKSFELNLSKRINANIWKAVREKLQ